MPLQQANMIVMREQPQEPKEDKKEEPKQAAK